MNKERELLERALQLIDDAYEGKIALSLCNEIKELLDQPEQEPEAWIVVNKETGYRTQVSHFPDSYDKNTFEVTPLYTSPPTREGLTPREGLTEYKKGYAQAELDLKRQPLTNENSDTVSAFNPVSNNYWSR